MTADDPRIPGWRLVRLIGQGGMGRVFLAHRMADGAQAAVKILSPSSGAGAPRTLMQRFARETRIMRGLEHPGLPRLLDAGVVPGDDLPYLVSEYLEGTTMDESPSFGTWDERALRGHLVALLDTLTYLHGLGILHRDLKPANVFLTTSGRTVLLDLGLVHDEGGTRLTATGFVVGTLATLAPEQLRGAEATVRSDLYQLAATAWLALTGRPPRPPGAPVAARVASLHPDPSRWPLLADFLRLCLSPDPDLRPPDARAALLLLGPLVPLSLPSSSSAQAADKAFASGSEAAVSVSRSLPGRPASALARTRGSLVRTLAAAAVVLAFLVLLPSLSAPPSPTVAPLLRPGSPAATVAPLPPPSSPAATALASARALWAQFQRRRPDYDPLEEECRTGERLAPGPVDELEAALTLLEPLVAAPSPEVPRPELFALLAEVLQGMRSTRAHEALARILPSAIDELAGGGAAATAILRRLCTTAWSQSPSWRDGGRSFPGPELEAPLWRLASAESDPSLAASWRVFLAGVVVHGRQAADDAERILRTVPLDLLPAADRWRFHYVTAQVAALRSDVEAGRAAYSRGIEAALDRPVRMYLTRNLYVLHVNTLFGDATEDLQSTTGF